MARVCAHCKKKMMSNDPDGKIMLDRRDPRYGESYIDDGKEDFPSHGICNKCMQELYPDIVKESPEIISNPQNNTIN